MDNMIRRRLWFWATLVSAFLSSVAVPPTISLCLAVLAGAVGVLSKKWPLAFALASLVSLPLVTRELAREWWRPLFYNYYYGNDFSLLRTWQPWPTTDDRGNVLVADFRLNLLLLVIAPEFSKAEDREEFGKRAWHGIMFKGSRRQVPVICGFDESASITIQRCTNRMILIGPACERIEVGLPPGRAEELFHAATGPSYISSLRDALDPQADQQVLTAIRRLTNEAPPADSGTCPPASAPASRPTAWDPHDPHGRRLSRNAVAATVSRLTEPTRPNHAGA